MRSTFGGLFIQLSLAGEIDPKGYCHLGVRGIGAANGSTFVLVGGGCILIPKMPLFKVILLSQVANGILIPFVLIFMLKLVNRESLMGEMRNGTTANVIAVSMTVVMIVLTAMMLWFSIVG